MDPLTHALLGAVISDAGFRRRLAPAATPFAMALATLPDLDAVTYWVSPLYAWSHHRGYTHSFFLQFLASPILGYLGWRLGKKSGSWLRWSGLALACLFSHTLLDLTGSWGVMPLLPFSNARISWDIAPIIDLFVFSTTASAFFANRLLRREKVAVPKNPLAYPIVHSYPGRQRAANWIGVAALLLLAVYLLIGWRQNRQTIRIAARELAAAGVEPVEVRALPLLLTSISWALAARDAEGSVYNAFYSSYAPRPMRFIKFPNAGGRAIEQVLATPQGRLFAWFTQGMYVAGLREPPGRTGTEAELGDRRFFSLDVPYPPRFAMRFAEGPDGSMFWVEARQSGLRSTDFREEFSRLWNLTRYGDLGGEAAATVE